jgi:hypothetical protein
LDDLNNGVAYNAAYKQQGSAKIYGLIFMDPRAPGINIKRNTARQVFTFMTLVHTKYVPPLPKMTPYNCYTSAFSRTGYWNWFQYTRACRFNWVRLDSILLILLIFNIVVFWVMSSCILVGDLPTFRGKYSPSVIGEGERYPPNLQWWHPTVTGASIKNIIFFTDSIPLCFKLVVPCIIIHIK